MGGGENGIGMRDRQMGGAQFVQDEGKGYGLVRGGGVQTENEKGGSIEKLVQEKH